MILSLSGFLFEDGDGSQSIGFAEFCALARQGGYDGVELRRTQVQPDTPEQTRKELLTIVRDAGLYVTCLTARGLPNSGDERDEFFRRYLDLCQDMQCNLMKIGGETSWLGEAASIAQEQEVTLASNNHLGSPLQTVAGTRQYFQEINHENFKLLYDSFHLNIAGEDYLGCISEFVNITRNILVHSVRPAQSGQHVAIKHEDKSWAVALPDQAGVQNWPAIIREFKKLGYDGLITIFESGWPKEKRCDVAMHSGMVLRKLWNG